MVDTILSFLKITNLYPLGLCRNFHSQFISSYKNLYNHIFFLKNFYKVINFKNKILLEDTFKNPIPFTYFIKLKIYK